MFKLNKFVIAAALVGLLTTVVAGVSIVSADSSVPAIWKSADIGSVGVAGDASYTNGTFTVKGGGTDIWGTADSFHYVYQPLNGNGEITARVVSQQNTNEWGRAGVMIRESLAAGSRQVISAITPGMGASFSWRPTTDASSVYVDGKTASAPYWVRLNRTGNVFTVYKSANGTTWTQYGQQTITMASSVYAGLAVSSHNNAVSATDTFDHISVSDTTAPVITTIGTNSVTATGAKVTWTTNESANSQVQFGKTTSYGSQTTVDSSLVTAHSATLSGLSPSTVYHYRVLSKDASGNLATSADKTFTTVTPDTTAPVISGISSSSLSSSGAKIAWATNESSDSQVEFGKTISYGAKTTVNSSATTAHSVVLSGLDPATTYHYRVLSRDASGNLATSSDQMFGTLAAAGTNPSNGRTTVKTSTNYTAKAGDFVIVSPTSGSVTITLSGTPKDGDFVSVKRNGLHGNGILVMPAGGVKIDDLTSDTVNSDWQSQDYYSDGAQWYRV